MKTKMTIKNQKGAAAVEFALIAPLLFVLLFGIVEFGFLLYNQVMITNAAREGARAGIIFKTSRPTLAEITTVVNTYCATHMINFDPSQTPATSIVQTDNSIPANGTPDSGDSLEVTVQYTYNFLLFPNLAKLFGGFFANIQNLNAVTRMRYE
jgi:Flp pilus assembly protein TadG